MSSRQLLLAAVGVGMVAMLCAGAAWAQAAPHKVQRNAPPA